MDELYIFGSTVTGNIDPGSDVDILVILDKTENKHKYPTNWSVFSKNKIEDIFNKGTLFSWHLYLESLQIYPKESKGFLYSIGEPEPYSNCEEEVNQLVEIAIASVHEIQNKTKSFLYEFGLIYVTARDISMASYYKLSNKFNFSRYAPFELQNFSFPFSLDEYQYMMNCRRTSIRDFKQTNNIQLNNLIFDKTNQYLSWCTEVMEAIK